MTKLIFIRHAQSHQSAHTAFSEWPLSTTGQAQAHSLRPHLETFKINKMYSSPFLRCRETVRPFVEASQMPVAIHDDLREVLIANGLVTGFEEVWKKAWDDFTFALPSCEPSGVAQKRFVAAVREIAERHPNETIGISTHGMVIALFLNYLDPQFVREHAETIRNPEVVEIDFKDGEFLWSKRDLSEAIAPFATHHSATPVTR